MSTTHDEIKIDLDEIDAKKAVNGKEEPKKDAVEVVRADDTTQAADKTALQTDAGLEKLKKQLESETTARIAAERRAQEASESEARARGDVQATQIDLLTNAITSVKSANDALKSEYAAARAAGDIDREWEIQQTLSTNAAKLLALENGKTQLEKQPKPVARPQLDVVDEYVGRIPVEYPRSRQWVRTHPEYVQDDKKNRLMIAAHELALAKGHTADTDDYFDSIEKTLDLRKPVVDDAPHLNGDADPMADAASKPIPRKAPPAAAPVTRSGNGAGARPNTVTLTAQEVEIAEMNGMTPEEYGRAKLALKKEGRLN